MRRQLASSTLTFLLLAAAFGVPARAAQEPVKTGADPVTATYGVRYEIRFLDLHAAEALAWEQCPAGKKDRCKVTAFSSSEDNRPGTLEVQADSATHEKIAGTLAREDATPRTQAFHLVLLAAGPKAPATEPDLPEGARKALQDLRGFLPFKGYEVLDSTWIRTTRSASGRLVGRKGQGYDVELSFRKTGRLDSKELFVSSFRLTEDPSMPIALADGKPRPPRRLIITSFGLQEGETLVVGTSRLDGGDEALVLLLTAVP